MGTMNKLRENTGIILWILVISFGGLWVLQDSGVFDTLGGNPLQKTIVVNGDAITLQEYQNAINARADAYRQQTGESMSPQRLDLEYDRVFDELVDDKLRQHEIERLGITVTNEELMDLVFGDEPDPVIAAYFGDGQGGIDRAALQSFIDAPEAQAQLIPLEDYLIAKRRAEKLNNLIKATVRISDEDVEAEYQRRNRRATAEFFALRYADVPDDSVTLSDGDVRAFYNAHRDEFKRKRSHKIKVASLSKNPSPEDTLAVLEDLGNRRDAFARAEDDSLFLVRFASERPYTSAFFGRGDFDEPIAEAVFEDPQPGKIVGPIISENQVHLVKIRAVRPAEETTVRARHILFRADVANPTALAAVREEAQQFKRRLQNGEDFATLAAQRSDDPGSKVKGGDLGWFGPGTMVAPFQEAAFSASIGRVVGPVETQYGVHLIEVLERAEVEVQVADYAETLHASAVTLSAAEDQLDELSFYANAEGGFVQEAERRNIAVQDVEVEQDQRFIPGIGNSRALLNFLHNAKAEEISKVIELDETFIVAYVVEIRPEGYRPFEEVEAEVRPRALREKKQEVQRARMQRAYARSGFDGLGAALGQPSRTAANLSAGNMTVPGFGRDAVFAGTVMGLAEGEDSGVVAGENAVFVVKATRVVEPPPITDAERQSLREQMVRQRQTLVQSQWVASLREKADVQDMRPTFEQ